jgi:hypothetical protein
MKTKDVYEIVGWTWHWEILKNGQRLLRDGKRFWFTRKASASKYVSDLKKGLTPA